MTSGWMKSKSLKMAKRTTPTLCRMVLQATAAYRISPCVAVPAISMFAGADGLTNPLMRTFTYGIDDLGEDGTRLSKEFVAFLKE